MIDLIKYKYTTKYLPQKIMWFKISFIFLILYAFLLVFFIFFLVFFPPSSANAIFDNSTSNFGFYSINVFNSSFGNLYINWKSITLSILAIFYVIYICLFYWRYWNSEWISCVKNSYLMTFLISSGILIVGGIILGFINSPFLKFNELNPTLGLENSELIEGNFNYNFIYDCHFIKNDLSEIIASTFTLSNYGILSIVLILGLIFIFVASTIIMFIKRNF